MAAGLGTHVSKTGPEFGHMCPSEDPILDTCVRVRTPIGDTCPNRVLRLSARERRLSKLGFTCVHPRRTFVQIGFYVCPDATYKTIRNPRRHRFGGVICPLGGDICPNRVLRLSARGEHLSKSGFTFVRPGGGTFVQIGFYVCPPEGDVMFVQSEKSSLLVRQGRLTMQNK